MRRLLSLCLLFAGPTSLTAGDWPQWLGPNRDGSSSETIAPWRGQPKVMWRKPVAAGHSSPVVAEGRVYLMTKVPGKDAEQLTAYDAKSGKVLWNESYKRGEFSSIFGVGPRATPLVADGKVFTFGVTGILTCFDVDNGKQNWQVDTLTKFKASNLFFGTSSSPLLEAGNVLVEVGGKGASVVAFKKDSGDVAWKSLDDKASYSSPVAIGEGAKRQVICLTQAGAVSLRASDGKPVWRYPFVDKLNESSTTPVRIGNILLISSVTIGSAGLNLIEKDGKPAVTRAWANPKLTCYFSTPVAVGEYVYMVTGQTLFPQAKLHCVEAKTGKVMWTRPKVGKYHAALLRTADNKLLLHGDDGNLTLIDPDPSEYKQLAQSHVCGPTWAHPALANGLVYLRDEKELICLKLGE